MTPGPWSVGRLMGGFCIKNPRQVIICEMRGSQLPHPEHKRNAETIAALPELVETLRLAEVYFGDLPSSDKAALRIHGKIVRALVNAGADLADQDEDAA